MAGKLETGVAQHDKPIAAIQKLILTGMRMINQNSAEIKLLIKSQRETDRRLRETEKLVRETSQTLQNLMRSMGRKDQANGHSKPPAGV
jgi:Tfp pilus assembly protein PilN